MTEQFFKKSVFVKVVVSIITGQFLFFSLPFDVYASFFSQSNLRNPSGIKGGVVGALTEGKAADGGDELKQRDERIIVLLNTFRNPKSEKEAIKTIEKLSNIRTTETTLFLASIVGANLISTLPVVEKASALLDRDALSEILTNRDSRHLIPLKLSPVDVMLNRLRLGQVYPELGILLVELFSESNKAIVKEANEIVAWRRRIEEIDELFSEMSGFEEKISWGYSQAKLRYDSKDSDKLREIFGSSGLYDEYMRFKKDGAPFALAKVNDKEGRRDTLTITAIPLVDITDFANREAYYEKLLTFVFAMVHLTGKEIELIVKKALEIKYSKPMTITLHEIPGIHCGGKVKDKGYAFRPTIEPVLRYLAISAKDETLKIGEFLTVQPVEGIDLTHHFNRHDLAYCINPTISTQAKRVHNNPNGENYFIVMNRAILESPDGPMALSKLKAELGEGNIKFVYHADYLEGRDKAEAGSKLSSDLIEVSTLNNTKGFITEDMFDVVVRGGDPQKVIAQLNKEKKIEATKIIVLGDSKYLSQFENVWTVTFAPPAVDPTGMRTGVQLMSTALHGAVEFTAFAEKADGRITEESLRDADIFFHIDGAENLRVMSFDMVEEVVRAMQEYRIEVKKIEAGV